MLQSAESYRQLVEEMESTDVQFDQKRLALAWETAQEAYEGQMHWTGESVMDHVLGVLRVLLPFQPDEDAVIACLLHHVLQCKYCTLVELEDRFGPKIRELVSGVHLLAHISLRGRHASVEDLRLMLLTVSDDIRTILIILCNRCYLVNSSHVLPIADARGVAQESLQLFAPVAARLGMYNLKNTLETQAFPIMYPSDANRLVQQLHRVHKRHGDVLGRVSNSLKDFFAENDMDVEISIREKQLFSIFRKMKEKSLSDMLDLYDLFAVRVIVHSEADCYRALGLLHRLGRPVPNRFKDYIAFPKPNGYQSLHSTLMRLPGTTDDSICIEAQIRTAEMHREAEFGIAAHWMYKEDGSAERVVQAVELHSVLSSQHALSEGTEMDTLADHIFVLTPHGDIVELPAGATPLDLAFQIHTDLGLAFRGARVNGSMVTIDYHLENGDVVEILKNNAPNPSPQWMQLLKMSSSRSRLKRYLYAQNRPQFVASGRVEVNKALRKHHMPVLDSDLSVLRKYDGQTLTMQQREDILMKIGQRSERVATVLLHLDALKDAGFEAPVNRVSTSYVPSSRNVVVIEGGMTMPTNLAKCCSPSSVKNPSIQGVVSRKGDIKVHKTGCRMLRNANTERLVKVWWE